MLRDHLGDIDVPVVLLLGAVKHKSGPPEDEVAILQALLTNFAIDTVAGTGYFIQEERPDAVTATIRHLVAPKMSVGKSR